MNENAEPKTQTPPAPVQTPASVNIEDLLFGSQLMSEEFVVGGHKVKVRSLTSAEREEIMSLPLVRGSSGLIDKMEQIKRPTVSRAIVSIDGVDWASRDEIRRILDKNKGYTLPQAIEELLKEASSQTINFLYELYLRVMTKERQAMDELKKDLPNLPSEIGGESAGTSALDLMARLL